MGARRPALLSPSATQVQEPGPPMRVASEWCYHVPSKELTGKALDAVCCRGTRYTSLESALRTRSQGI